MTAVSTRAAGVHRAPVSSTAAPARIPLRTPTPSSPAARRRPCRRSCAPRTYPCAATAAAAANGRRCKGVVGTRSTHRNYPKAPSQAAAGMPSPQLPAADVHHPPRPARTFSAFTSTATSCTRSERSLSSSAALQAEAQVAVRCGKLSGGPFAPDGAPRTHAAAPPHAPPLEHASGLAGLHDNAPARGGISRRRLLLLGSRLLGWLGGGLGWGLALLGRHCTDRLSPGSKTPSVVHNQSAIGRAGLPVCSQRTDTPPASSRAQASSVARLDKLTDPRPCSALLHCCWAFRHRSRCPKPPDGHT